MESKLPKIWSNATWSQRFAKPSLLAFLSSSHSKGAAVATDRNAILEIVRTNLAEILEIDASSIGEAQAFADDLGADSIALIELVDTLEQHFSAIIPNFQFDDDDLADLRTVADAVDYIVRAHG